MLSSGTRDLELADETRNAVILVLGLFTNIVLQFGRALRASMTYNLRG